MPLAAWLAPSTTVPGPVTVTVAPDTLAGPLMTEYVTAPFEAELAETVNGVPTATDGIDANCKVGTPGFTTKLVLAVAAP